jgi:omega-hydroxy-beta-dihydromenaquinone-9 sulfotransferase
MASIELPQTIQYPTLSPRFWHGMPSRVWIPLLWKNSFKVSLSRLHIASGVTAFMPFSDLMGLLQHTIFGRKIAQTKLVGPPLFILGHWRSGTTLLHELLCLDDRFASPTTFECFAPAHFLLTEPLVTRYGNWLIPNRRPMDNMKAGWSLPQEDEFALMNLGAPTPYLRLVFPCHDYPYQSTLASDGFSLKELERWKYLFDWFLKALTYKNQKPLILKSPPHTGRIGILKSLYPDAKFVHIVRDPRKLFPSTMKLWNSLDHVQSIQVGEYQPKLKEFVLKSLTTMYDSFERDRVGLSDKQLIDVRYEDLAKDSVAVCKNIYDQLDLGGFDRIEPLLKDRKEQEKEYKTNCFGSKPEEETEFMTAWHSYATKYGYA